MRSHPRSHDSSPEPAPGGVPVRGRALAGAIEVWQGVSRFWRPFSDAATKREPLVSRAAGGGAPRLHNHLSAPQGAFRGCSTV